MFFPVPGHQAQNPQLPACTLSPAVPCLQPSCVCLCQAWVWIWTSFSPCSLDPNWVPTGSHSPPTDWIPSPVLFSANTLLSYLTPSFTGLFIYPVFHSPGFSKPQLSSGNYAKFTASAVDEAQEAWGKPYILGEEKDKEAIKEHLS